MKTHLTLPKKSHGGVLWDTTPPNKRGMRLRGDHPSGGMKCDTGLLRHNGPSASSTETSVFPQPVTQEEVTPKGGFVLFECRWEMALVQATQGKRRLLLAQGPASFGIAEGLESAARTGCLRALSLHTCFSVSSAFRVYNDW